MSHPPAAPAPAPVSFDEANKMLEEVWKEFNDGKHPNDIQRLVEEVCVLRESIKQHEVEAKRLLSLADYEEDALLAIEPSHLAYLLKKKQEELKLLRHEKAHGDRAVRTLEELLAKTMKEKQEALDSRDTWRRVAAQRLPGRSAEATAERRGNAETCLGRAMTEAEWEKFISLHGAEIDGAEADAEWAKLVELTAGWDEKHDIVGRAGSPHPLGAEDAEELPEDCGPLPTTGWKSPAQVWAELAEQQAEDEAERQAEIAMGK